MHLLLIELLLSPTSVGCVEPLDMVYDRVPGSVSHLKLVVLLQLQSVQRQVDASNSE